MTDPMDEEFNRIEMESRIKQEYAMRKTTREEKISRPAVYEVPANNRMIASHQDHVRRLMEELAIARKCIREMGDRLSKLEKTKPVAWNLKDVTDAYKLGAKSQQRTWVGLTDAEVFELFCCEGTADSDINPFKLLADARRIEAKLKEKNND